MMYRLLCFLVLCGLARSASSISQSSSSSFAIDKCLDEAGLTNQYRIRDLTESVLNDPKVRCFVGCLWRERKWLKEDGRLNPAKWLSPLSRKNKKRIEAITECADNSYDDDLCEMVHKFYMCFNAKQMGST